jgi:transcriptional regulator with XRE-family HTH domain
MTFGQRLKDLRTAQDMTQQDLADQTHIARSTLGMYEQDRRRPDFESLDALADLFDVSFDYLLCKVEINTGYPRHGDEAMVRRVTAYAQKLAEAYQNASPDTQAAVRAILHLEEDPTDGDR